MTEEQNKLKMYLDEAIDRGEFRAEMDQIAMALRSGSIGEACRIADGLSRVIRDRVKDVGKNLSDPHEVKSNYVKGVDLAKRPDSSVQTTETRSTNKGETKNMEEKKEVQKVHVAEIVRHGQQFVIPVGVTLPIAVELLQRRIREEEEQVSVVEAIDGFVWEGALAAYKAMQQLFGFAHQEATKTMFGDRPPSMISIDVGYNKTESVPWGRFSLPGVEGYLESGYHLKDGLISFRLCGVVKRKHMEQIKAVAELARKIVREQSIYRGKAVSIRWLDNDGVRLDLPEPKFLDLSKTDETAIVFSEEVENAITTSLFTPIEHSKTCREMKIPLKRGVLLSGRYGTGKTLVTYVTAAKCVRNGWTFLHCQRADELAYMVRFAKSYQPAVIFCEDIDRVMSGERTTAIDDILNIIDGIESKNTELMVVLTTNHIENINAAMLRPGRLDAVINVLPPDAKAAERLVKLYSGKLLDKEADLKAIGLALAGQIPAVIRECVERSKLAAIKISNGEAPVITAAALLDAVDGMKNQMELLAKGSEKHTPHQKLVAVLGEKLVQDLDLKFATNGNNKGN